MITGNRLIVVAYPDSDYIRGLEKDLLEKLDASDTVQVLTGPEYLMNFFGIHRTVDALIISEEFIGNYLQEHDIRNLMILENKGSFATGKVESEQKLLHYAGHEDVLRFLERSLSGGTAKKAESEKEPEEAAPAVRVVSVYSPIGGSGKSLTAFALAKKLKKLGEKVLVIGCDDLQSVGVFLETRENADEELAADLAAPTDKTYWKVLKNVTQDDVPSLLPFEKPLSALSIGAKELANLVTIIQEKKDFSYIILDLGTPLTEETLRLVALSDIRVVVTEPNLIAARKMEKLNMNYDLFGRSGTIMIVNKFHSDGFPILRDNVFGTFAAYNTHGEAMEDPLFYRLALQIIGEGKESCKSLS